MPSRSDLLEPIAGPSPGGASLRYEPVYDQIKAARTEQEAIPEWGQDQKPADWKLVIKLAGDALAKKSKDLQLAAWYTEALLNYDGIGGLADGLELMRELLENFWDHLWPELEDGDAEFRAAPLDWVGQYLNLAVRLTPITAAGHTIDEYQDSRRIPTEAETENDWDKQEKRRKEIEAGRMPPEQVDKAFNETPKAWYKQLVADIDAALAALASLQEVADAKFGEVSPSFSRLRGALEEVRVQAGRLLAIKLEQDPDPVEIEPAVETVEAAAAADGSASRPAGAGSASAAAGAGLSPTPTSRDDAAARVAAAARYLRAQAPTEPAPYLMLRGFRWGELRARGSDVDPRLLAAPPTDVRTKLKGLMLDAHWAQLLEGAEDVMATPFGRGWLDLQRYVLSACDGLGSEYDHVAAAIKGALRALLRDLPQLPDLTLMDDSPTANAETRRWLAQAGLFVGAEDGEAGAMEPTAAAVPGRGVYDRAMERLRAGQPERAVEILMREVAQEKSARAKFMRRSQAARIMVDAGLETVAMPILEDMIALIEKHGLEEWEDGETVAQPLGLLYRCLERLDGDSSTRQSLYLRVCRLDPLQAMQFANPANEQAG